MEIALFLLAGCLLVYLASRSQDRRIPAPPYQPRSASIDSTPDTAPLINYTILVADPRSGQWLHIEAPEDYPDHYGILEGQYIQLRWQVLHADFIHIEGIGYVQAVGSKDLFPQQATRYRIVARNRNHQATKEIVIHVFPVPVMEHFLSPAPDLNICTELQFDPLPLPACPQPSSLPRINQPGLVPLQQKLQAETPKPLSLIRSKYELILHYNTINKLKNNILSKIKITPGLSTDQTNHKQ